MIINKITNGFVSQLFDTETGKYTHQEFVAGDVEYENQMGDPVDPKKVGMQKPDGTEPYLPFDMIQPGEMPFVGGKLELPRCAVCQHIAITKRKISINNRPKKSLPVCQIHADAADEDKKVEKRS